MNFDKVKPSTEISPEESQLVKLAKSGDVNAFVQLYDAFVEEVYRFIYFRVINSTATEDITSQVFRKAWEQLEKYPIERSVFSDLIFKIAQEQVMEYYETNLRNHSIDVDFLSVPADFGLNKEVQDLIKLEVMRNHLRFLSPDPKRNVISKLIFNWTTNRNILHIITRLENDIHSLQVNTLQTIAKFVEYLNLGREIKPSPTFNSRTRLWLTQYLQFHTRHPQRSTLFWRMALTYTLLVAGLLITGTAKAQSALPGDVLYGWKRTSEEALLTLSPDPVGTDIFLANRRLDEWIAVENDPERNASALANYYDALSQLDSSSNPATRDRILPILKVHRQRLSDSGISTSQLDNYLTVQTNPTAAIVDNQILPAENVTTAKDQNINSNNSSNLASSAASVPTSENNSSSILSPTEVALPPTDAATQVAAPSITDVPTEVAPPPTDIPTAAAAAVATDVSTALPQSVTQVSIDASAATQPPAPAATDVPSQAAPAATQPPAPAATDVPSQVAPPATQPPAPASTDVSSPAAPPATQPPAPAATGSSSGSTNSGTTQNNPGLAPASATP